MWYVYWGLIKLDMKIKTWLHIEERISCSVILWHQVFCLPLRLVLQWLPGLMVSLFKLLSSRLIAAQHDTKTAESREIRCEYIPRRSPAKMELTNQSFSAQTQSSHAEDGLIISSSRFIVHFWIRDAITNHKFWYNMHSSVIWTITWKGTLFLKWFYPRSVSPPTPYCPEWSWYFKKHRFILFFFCACFPLIVWNL